MQKILGLDFGSYSIKAVEITHTFNAYKIERFYEVAVPEIEGIEQELIEYTAIRQLFSENSIEVDRTFTAMNGLIVSTRTFNLQNVKKRDVPLVVQNELEASAPFNMEETVFDQQIIDVSNGVTSVLSAMCRKEHIEGFLGALKELEIEPKVIDVDYLSYINIFPFLKDEDASKVQEQDDSKLPVLDFGESCKLILDIGHMKTAMILVNGNKFVTARTIRMGGLYITEILAKGLDITYGEAQRLKHAVSYLEYKQDAQPTPGREKEFQVAQQMALAATDLVKEVIRTLHSFKAHERLVPSQILVTGGTACIKNIVPFLEASIELPIKHLNFNSDKLKIDEADEDKTPILSQALAIALRGVPNKLQSQINMRKGELALVGSYDAVFKQLSNITLLAIGLILCLAGSYGLRWWLYNDQIETLKTQFRAEVKQTLGSEPKELKNIAAEKNWRVQRYAEKTFTIMERDSKEKKKAIDGFLELQSVVPLKILREVSNKIDKSVSIDLTNFHVRSSGQVVIEGETIDFATAGRIEELVRNIEGLESVKMADPEKLPGSEKVKFSLSATISKRGKSE